MSNTTRKLPLLLMLAAGIASAQGFLGATVANVALVDSVIPGGLAASAGIKAGDVILSVDGRPVHSSQEVVNVLRSLRPAKRTLIEVSRAGEKMLLTIRPKAPDSAPGFQPPATAPAPAPAKAPAAPAAAAPIAGAPPLGDYGCVETWMRGLELVRDLKGGFTLMPGGQYRYLDGGEVGRYSYDPATHKLNFTGGYFGNTDAYGIYTPRNTGAQIDIHFDTKNRKQSWMCGHDK